MEYTVGEYKGYELRRFTVDGRESLLVCPAEPLPGNRWIWRAEFFGAFDTVDMDMVRRGWYLAYHRVSDMYGCPESIRQMHVFYETVVREFGLAEKTALFGFSRGGLYSVNYALTHPEEVFALYLDAPVLDMKSWPGGMGASDGDARCWEECKGRYGLTDDDAARAFRGNPLDRAGELARLGIPVTIVAGDSDRVVPIGENTMPFAKAFRAAGGVLEVTVKPGCDHHPHSLEEPTVVSDLLTRMAEADRAVGMFRRNFPYAKRSPASVLSILSNSANAFLWEREDGKDIGLAVVNADAVLLLCVDAAYRGRGIGSRLLARAEELIRQGGFAGVRIGAGFDYLTPGVPMRGHFFPMEEERIAIDRRVDDGAAEFFAKRGYVHGWADADCFDMRADAAELAVEGGRTDVVCRRGVPEDMDAVCAAVREAEEEFEKYYRNPLLYAGGNRERCLIAQDAKGNVLGALIVSERSEGENVGSVGCTAVRPSAQGRGVASELIRFGTAALREAGMREVFLGYTYTGLERMYGRSGYRVCTFYMMAEKKI